MKTKGFAIAVLLSMIYFGQREKYTVQLKPIS